MKMVGAIIGAVGSTLATNMAREVLEALIRTPSVPITPANAAAAEPAVERAVSDALVNSPRIQHLTNNEPWYRSNVTWGAIFAILGGTATIGTHVVLGTPLSFEAYGPPAGAIWGGAQALYGRWAARKPIGT
jgi:hypothetical protein